MASIEELKTLRENGVVPPVSFSRHLRDGMFELKVRHTTRISHSLFFYSVGAMNVFTHGFVKKTQKTPLGEIQKALRYRSIYTLS